jgi:hypothetical protein
MADRPTLLEEEFSLARGAHVRMRNRVELLLIVAAVIVLAAVLWMFASGPSNACRPTGTGAVVQEDRSNRGSYTPCTG